MTNKFKNKYRIPTARATFWNYGWNAAYFITICTKNRKCWFGHVAHREMVYSGIGRIAHKCWLEIPDHFPFVKLDSFVIMPNHVHGIIIINKNVSVGAETQNTASEHLQLGGDPQNVASVQLQLVDNPQNICNQNPISADDFPNICNKNPLQIDAMKNQFGPQSQNLASIVRGFKIGVTKYARAIHPEFMWQARYHDIIIRDERSFINIANYILNNPAKWEKDKFLT